MIEVSWQSIETAPKDGTAVMVYKSGWGVAVLAKWAECPDGNFNGWLAEDDGKFPGSLSDGFIGYEEEADIMPTHWIAPPK